MENVRLSMNRDISKLLSGDRQSCLIPEISLTLSNFVSTAINFVSLSINAKPANCFPFCRFAAHFLWG